jgi:NADP-dependent 3-hydroxy acid dehydrogenase YdfG
MGDVGTYLITGATGGIGAAVAELLQEDRHDLILTARSPDRLAELVKHLASPVLGKTQAISRERLAASGMAGSRPADGSRVATGSGASNIRTVPLDLNHPRRMEAALAVADLPDRLDGIVHSAGGVELGRIADMEADDWIDQLMVNLVGAAELTRLLLPALRAAHGHVVFVNSGSGLRARPGWAAYAASKHGLRALADALRDEEPSLAVTSVYPGRTASEMQRKVRAQEGVEYDPDAFIQPLTVAKIIVNALETPRDAVVTDISVRSREPKP